MEMELRSRASSSAEPWNQGHRRAESSTSASTPSSPNQVRRHHSRRSSNRVKAKPANPQVISSILTSLENVENDTLTPLPASDTFSDAASAFSRPDSSSRSVASSASIHRNISTPGFGVEYGVGLELDDEEGLSDAALPPTVPTSRPPSGLSNYTIKKSKSPGFSRPISFRPKASSRRSSFSATSTRAGSTRNKLSSESWVRKNLNTNNDDVAFDDAASFTSGRGRSMRKSLRRMSSQEMLRSEQQVGPSLKHESPSVSLAEQIIARTPPAPLSQSKGRLYLHDATINEHQPLAESPESPTPIPFTSEQSTERTPDIENRDPLEAPREDSSKKSESPDERLKDPFSKELEVPTALNATPPLKTPSPISDSIPTRTSSLRQSSNSPASGKKKHKKSKRHSATPSKAETMKPAYKRSKSIPDSSWADLGEDDETVRRIRQLREQRKSRLHENTLYSSPVIGEEAEENPTLVYELASPPSGEIAPTPQTQTGTNGSASTPLKRIQLLGVDEGGTPSQISNVGRASGARSVSPGGDRKPKHSLEVKRPQSEFYRPRPASSKSENASINPLPSLDYSYAQAVDTLSNANGSERRAASSRPRPSRESSQRSSLQGSDLPSPIDPTKPAIPRSRTSKKSKKPQDRWTAGNHPDLPLDLDRRKSRRKSMSDTRMARAIVEEEEMARRDSIEDAVSDYLDSPRLTKSVKNPNTGRTIAFSEVGDPEGAAVFVCVGMGLTRYVTAFFDELAVMLRLRLITLDRPGVGASEALPATDKSGPLNWPEDVLAVCQHLGIIKFSILAHSAGAIYALATALILPHLVKGKVHLLAPWVPPSQLEAISHPTASTLPANPLPRSQRFLRVLPTPFLKAANSSFMTATSASLKPATKRNVSRNTPKTTPRKGAVEQDDSPRRPMSHDRPDYNRRESMMLMDQFMPETNPMENFPLATRDGEDDDAAFKRSLVVSATASPTDPNFAYATNGLNAAEHAERERQVEYTSRLTQRTWDLATRDSNPATDLLVCLERNRDVGFRYTDVGREIVITHGSEDKRVPVANVKWLAEQMNRRALGMNLGARESRESWADPNAKGGCEVRVLQGEGHGLMASPAIMGDVLTEIAGYWVGQDKGRL